MPQWAGSCWYYLRYIDPHNTEALVDPAKERYWMPVDIYIGGSEHAVLHLLYARFWHKVLYDAGVVSSPEPFSKLVHQGMMLGELEYTTYVDERGAPVSAEHVRGGRDARSGAPVTAKRIAEAAVTKQGERFVLCSDAAVTVDARAHKMSKSRGNVVNPDEVVALHGADAFRLYEMFMGPLEQVKPWSTSGVDGTHRFLNRVWRLLVDADGDTLREAVRSVELSTEQARLLHQTIAKVTEDIEALRLNTAIAALMELTNAAYKWDTLPVGLAEKLVLLLSPLAPHIAEELWSRLGHAESLAYAPWPMADPALLHSDTVELPVQVNGKVRAHVVVAADASEADLESAARAEPKIAALLDGGEVRTVIVVPGRMVSFVIS
jgi:leucyl-tRNA synthetase